MKRYIEIVIKFFKNRNFVPKLMSILLAVILWAYISSSKSGDLKFKLPLTFTGLEENYVVSKMSLKVVVVEVRGDKDDLKNVSSKNFKLVVDLTKSEPGDYKFYTIQYQKIDLTDDYKVELYPKEVKILIEKKITRNVKIIPRYSGYPEKGFIVGKIRVNPEYVRISGPGSIVNNLSAIYTDDIPVDEKNASYRQDVKITRVNEEGLEYNLPKVLVTIPVLNYSEITSFEIPVVIKNKKKGFKYIFDSGRVKINTLLTGNKNISERSFLAFIDANEIELDNDDFINKNRIEVAGYIHVIGDSSESDNCLINSIPDSAQIVVTKE